VIPLRDLEAEITSTQIGGVSYSALLIVCPTCRTHSQLIPYSDAPATHLAWPEAGPDRMTPTWQRTAGSAVDDLTLTPSFLVPSCPLHGWVRSGAWHPC
jgi:hypothetical protein